MAKLDWACCLLTQFISVQKKNMIEYVQKNHILSQYKVDLILESFGVEGAEF